MIITLAFLLILLLVNLNVAAQVTYGTSSTTYSMYGLSTDTKPVSPANDCYFIETNTGNTYRSSGGNWVLASMGANMVSSTYMPTSVAADSITNMKATIATKLAAVGFTKAAMIALGMMAYSDSAAALSPYLRSTVATATYQPVGAYATATSSTVFTNKTGSNNQWTNDAGYLTISSTGIALSTRTISTTSPLAGGGDLSANRTLTIANAKADNATLGAATFDSTYFNDNGSGLISYGVNYGTGSVSAAAVTINHPRGKITYTSPSITAGTAIAVTFTNSFITATSTINIGLNGNGSNLTLVNAYVKSQTSGSCVINIQNLSLLSLFNSTFIIDYFIVN